MKKAMIFGTGTVGSALIKALPKDEVSIETLVRSSGLFTIDLKKIGELREWKKFADQADIAFICIPTRGRGEDAFGYASYFLERGKLVITCEKASVAFHWDYFKDYKNLFRYTASVGGGTKMLKEISDYLPKDIHEIKAVVNGTLNYISDNLKKGVSKEVVIKEVLEKGFAEPGAATFEEIVDAEMNDVILKSVIVANHSGMFKNVITKKDIEVVLPATGSLEAKRCIVKLTKESIQAGFIENTQSLWLPTGVNNVLYINGEKKAYGPGAGAEATASAMIADLP